ncbi:MAG TPA: multidrug efflux SMR transporter [Pseudonocardiaceae bacterium]|nr:multidrug efflux SMR transporter [Pseudonocardiaceae bacterium]
MVEILTEDEMVWILLVGAIAAEVTATSALKLSDGFSKLAPSLVVAVGYIVSFALLALALKKIEVSVAYAIWSGVGTAAVAMIGVVAMKEPLTAAKVVGVLLIIGGVVTLNLTGSH